MFGRSSNRLQVTLDPQEREAIQYLAKQSATSPEQFVADLARDAILDGHLPDPFFFPDGRNVTRAANGLIAEAVSSGATQMRIFGSADEFHVSYCIDGIWQQPRELPELIASLLQGVRKRRKAIFDRYENMVSDQSTRFGEEGMIPIHCNRRNYDVFLRFLREDGVESAYLRFVEKPAVTRQALPPQKND